MSHLCIHSVEMSHQRCVCTKTLRSPAFTLTIGCSNNEINVRMCVPPCQLHVWRMYIFCFLSVGDS